MPYLLSGLRPTVVFFSTHDAGRAAPYLSSHTVAGPTTAEGALKSAARSLTTKSKDGRTILREYVGIF